MFNSVNVKRFSSSREIPYPHFPKYIGYYAALGIITVLGVVYGYYFSELFFASDKPHWVEAALNGLKLFWLVPLPYAIMNFYSFLRYPAIDPQKIAPSFHSITRGFEGKLYFRYVTRGLNPNLVKDNVLTACKLLPRVLQQGQWAVEVVSDHPVLLPVEAANARVILVPADYQPPHGAKFKARALHYALSASAAGADDWIVHLDEETGFNEETVKAIYQFVIEESGAVAAERRRYPRIGQGVILYGARQVVNWLTTLADSIRVGDDYGRFRLQYENGKAYFGIHGSFIVINNEVEQMVGMDHGPAASITEDAYFALMAQSMGVEFGFIHTFMYEKSPFSLKDFVKQRQRWFSGLWLCVLSPDIPWRERIILGTFMVLWSISWLCIVMVYVNLFYPTGTPYWLAMSGGVSFAYYVTLYLVGFFRTFSWRDGKRRFAMLLLAQTLLIPIFSLMEAAGVFLGLFRPPRGFYVVQKEMTPPKLTGIK